MIPFHHPASVSCILPDSGIILAVIIREVYDKYQIMPNLQEHQLRVAGVGKIIADNWRGKIDTDLVIKTCLLHDVGNVVKFDLSERMVKKYGIEDVKYWERVQTKYREKYGRDSHKAAEAIVSELGQDDVFEILREEYEVYNTATSAEIIKAGVAAKILLYADMRVVPEGVVEMGERVADLAKRYGRERKWFEFLFEVEKNIQSQTTTDVAEITEERVSQYFSDFLSVTI